MDFCATDWKRFVVDSCDNGDKGYALDRTRIYDAIVLDLTVPGRNGLSILRNLRDQHATGPVILRTARSSLNERLAGLNLGADDYLTKPFYSEELDRAPACAQALFLQPAAHGHPARGRDRGSDDTRSQMRR